MSDLIYDERDEAKLKFSEAVFRVWRKRYDLEAVVMQGHRDFLTKRSNDDPFVRFGMLSVAISQARANPDDPSYNDARLEMITALLHVWYRIQPDLKSIIMTAVREIAIIHDNDVDLAVFSAHQVIDGARDAGSALTEQREAIQIQQAKTRTAHEDTKVNQLRKRLKDEHMRSA